MKRDGIMEGLMEALSSYYKISELDEEAFFAEYHNTGDNPQDMLWPVEDNEYTFIYGTSSVSDEYLNNVIKDSLEIGLTHVRPGPNHKTSLIHTIIISDKADGNFDAKIKNYRFMKKYRLSIHGSAEQGVILVDATKKKIYTNRTAKKVAEGLRNMFSLS